MLPINKKVKLIFIGLGSSLIVCLFINTIFARLPESWDLTDNFDLFFYNLFFTSTLESPDSLVIIDSKDLKEREDRAKYASMIRQLCNAGASCIALDIYFPDENNLQPEKDRELINSIKDCPNVVFAVDLAEGEPIDAIQLKSLDSLALPDSTCEYFTQKITADMANLPFDSLLSVVKYLGHINTVQEQYHHFPVVISVGRKCIASLPIQIANLYFNSDKAVSQDSDNKTDAIESNSNAPGSFRIQEIPLDKDDQILVNFIRVEEFLPLHSWEEALQQLKADPDQFRDKVVLIVKTAGETKINSPLGPYPRWALIASVTSQLMLKRHIDASVLFSPIFFSTMIVLAGIIWLLLIAPRMDEKWRRPRFLFLAGNSLFLFIIFVLLRFGQQWIGVVVPLLMFTTSMLVVRKIYNKMIKPPLYEDFILEVLERKGNKYPVKVSKSPVGEDTSDVFFESFLDDEKFKEIIIRIKEWRATQEDIRWMGDKLFNALIQSDVYQLLTNSLYKVESEKKYLQLKLCIDPPELVCLPWELMCSSNFHSVYVALHKRISLVRYLPLAQPLRAVQSRQPLKILIFVSGADNLEIAEEKELIRKALKPFIRSLDVRLIICEHATLESLSSELERNQPDVLHYIGHADFDEEKNEAYLEFASGDKVSARTLRSLLQEPSIKLAVLNSCKTSTAAEIDAFTGIAQNLVKVGIPAVVAMQFKIPDSAAIWFSDIFYPTLFKLYSIDAAVAETRRKIMAKSDMDHQHWATPVLFMRTDDGNIFDSNEVR